MTELRKAIELFLGGYKTTSRTAYNTALKQMQDWVGPARELEDIKPPLLIEYFQVVISARGYAPATVTTRVKGLKVFFNWCVNNELLSKSPAFVLKAKQPPRRISRDKAMTDDELKTVLDYLRLKTNPRDFALVLFLADSGCRRGGAAGLRNQDIDFEELTAEVTEKGDTTRKVAFSRKCANAMLRWMSYRNDHFKITGVYVFSRNGERPDPEIVSEAIRRACAKCGIREMGSHSLRHRKGHQFADARVAPSLAATFLGHKDVMETLRTYYPDDWETAEKIGRELMTDAPEPPARLVKHKR